jgi:membrane protein YdbS with pleckstrin-like domain
LERLDLRVIPLQQVQGGIFIAFLALGSLAGLAISLPDDKAVSAVVAALMFGGWFLFALAGAWFAWRWPARAYAHTFYRVDADGIEIRKGVHWRTVLNVPRSRVQHIDVSQGPIERRYGLSTLVIYTAGTDHAKVELEGLEHGRALQVREQLLPTGTSDAV